MEIEEITELTYSMGTLLSQMQESYKNMDARFLKLETDIAQLAAEMQEEEVYLAESGLSPEETVLPNAEDDFYDSDDEFLSYFTSLREDFSPVQVESPDRVTNISRSSDFPGESARSSDISTRSSGIQEEVGRSSDYFARSTDLAIGSLDSPYGFDLDDDFDDDNG